MEKREIKLREEFIKLGQALKAAGVADNGVEAKYMIQDGKASVNGEVELRRGRKLFDQDEVVCGNVLIKIIK